MQFSSTLIAAIAFGMASAVQFTNSAFNGITAGEPIELTWSGASGPVTITLKNGPSTALNTVSTVASGQTGTTFTWNVPSTLTQDTYALEITDSTAVPNYSPQFELIGGAAATSSASASASSSSAVSSVSSVASSVSSSVSSVISSVQSSLSSKYESLTANTVNSTTSTAAPSTTGATNGTVSTGKPSTTGGATTTGSRTSSAGASTSTAVVPNSNSASDIASPLALVFLTFAAIFTLN